MSHSATATISAQDQGTDWVPVRAGQVFEVYPGSLGNCVITLQRRARPSDGNIYDIKDYTPGDEPEIGTAAAAWDYRLYCKTGGYTSGTPTIGIWVG